MWVCDSISTTGAKLRCYAKLSPPKTVYHLHRNFWTVKLRRTNQKFHKHHTFNNHIASKYHHPICIPHLPILWNLSTSAIKSPKFPLQSEHSPHTHYRAHTFPLRISYYHANQEQNQWVPQALKANLRKIKAAKTKLKVSRKSIQPQSLTQYTKRRLLKNI